MRFSKLKSIPFSTLLVFCFSILSHTQYAQAQTQGEQRMFTITGYYSPLPNQNFYITGTYESEKRLNGEGIAGADGTPVYAGMIAAPKSYAFGTKICFEGVGCGMVHDRGGAIVEAGKTTLAQHDRIDIWMGYGEEGLLRALAWGVKQKKGTVYPSNADIRVFMNFEVPPQLGDIIDLPQRPIFNTNLSFGNSGEKVALLQQALHTLRLYEGFQDGIYNEKVKEGVFQFQKQHFVVEKKTDIGAGVFGPQTRAKLTEVLYKKSVEEKIKEAWDSFHFENELSTGTRNHEVFKLQNILVQEEFMMVHPTGYFGPITKNALIDFQIAHNIIRSKNALGAGKVGPSTKKVLNQILENQQQDLAQEWEYQLAYEANRNELRRIAGQPLEFSRSLASQ